MFAMGKGDEFNTNTPHVLSYYINLTLAGEVPSPLLPPPQSPSSPQPSHIELDMLGILYLHTSCPSILIGQIKATLIAKNEVMKLLAFKPLRFEELSCHENSLEYPLQFAVLDVFRPTNTLSVKPVNQ